MEMIKNWIFEAQFEDSKLGYKIKEELVRRTTPYQELAIYDTYDFGKMLVLDGTIETTVKDEFIYNEMMAHVPLYSHPSPKKVLVLGGGNGGIVKELLKHKGIEKIVLCEIDEIVVEECKKHIPEISSGLNDPRVEVVIGDGTKYVIEHKNAFDIILADSTDPFSKAEGLFGGNFYESLRGCLTNDGILVAKSKTPFLQPDRVKQIYSDFKNFFPIAKLYTLTVPSFPGGIWTLTAGSKRFDPARPYNSDRPAFPLKYYTKDLHRAAFVHPVYIEELIK